MKLPWVLSTVLPDRACGRTQNLRHGKHTLCLPLLLPFPTLSPEAQQLFQVFSEPAVSQEGCSLQVPSSCWSPTHNTWIPSHAPSVSPARVSVMTHGVLVPGSVTSVEPDGSGVFKAALGNSLDLLSSGHLQSCSPTVSASLLTPGGVPFRDCGLS